MVFLFPPDKADLYYNYTKTNAASGMYGHLHFQLKYQHFWACCPEQARAWIGTSSWIDICAFSNNSACQKSHSSWPLEQGAPEKYPLGHCFSAYGFLWGPRWGGAIQGERQPKWRGFSNRGGHTWLMYFLNSHHRTERQGLEMLQNQSHSTKM